MQDYKTILDLIETVDPADDWKLSDIDGLVHVLIKEIAGPSTYVRYREYTRSRDALKAICPEGWKLGISWETSEECTALLYTWNGTDDFISYRGHKLPNAELAELHAIIQAIAYERRQ